jgi:hypothetical protein
VDAFVVLDELLEGFLDVVEVGAEEGFGLAGGWGNGPMGLNACQLAL